MLVPTNIRKNIAQKIGTEDSLIALAKAKTTLKMLRMR
jgi:hypothetical protein